MDYTYECTLCDRSLISSFYMCSNCHICCFRCYSLTPLNSCRVCGLGQVYCCEFSKYRLDESNNMLFKRSAGPIVVLPVSKEDFKDISTEMTGDHYCVSSGLNTCLPTLNKLMKCLDCHKCVFLSRVLEHYICEHKETLICPVPPGSMVTFRMRRTDLEEGQMKKLQLLQLMDVSEETSSTEDEGALTEGDEKIFFLMGLKVPLQHGKNDRVSIVKLWLFSTFHSCNTNYSLEVTNNLNNTVSIIFTGVPINASSMEPSAVSKNGNVLSMRESLLQHFENTGGCTVNIYIHNNNNIPMD